MNNKSKYSLMGLLIIAMLSLLNFTTCTKDFSIEKPYKPTWNSLRNHSTPEWLKDAKFGIYTHWGVWSVPAFARIVSRDDPPHPYKGISLKQVKSSKTMFDTAEERLEVIESLITLRTGRDGTWYPFNMYREGTDQYNYHVKTYGPPEEFGYKDFIPLFTAEKFDADEWAELFKEAGAQFAGPVAEHHDGYFNVGQRPDEMGCCRDWSEKGHCRRTGGGYQKTGNEVCNGISPFYELVVLSSLEERI